MSAPASMERRTCLLTGAGGTLGSAFCVTRAADYDIVAVYRSRHPEAASQLQWYVDPLRPDVLPEASRHRVFVVQADLARAGEVERVVQLALARVGHIDLVVNAAVTYGFGSTLDNAPLLEDALDHLAVNLLLPARLAAAVAREHWRHQPDENRRRNRNVVNMSSVSAIETYPGGQGMYAAAKAGLNALTRHMALDYEAIGVRVNALAPTSFPGLVPTQAIVERIGALDSGELTGTVTVVDTAGDRLV
ncbi:MAG: SDR family oxidoreductase [Candidatus Dormibacteraeota bacterium]|uniref:SDR family oxidoreductase n=1 Tax=Candidatus Amunia macphersoniae TaxID=3127014 RepID=A0A934NAX6_9BACT|nr:SDR family oxidoreductase [Candidatus Dormibacteraeota bacterium]